MITTEFIRDSARVYQALSATDTQLFAKEDLRIYIPERFVDKKLAFIGSEIYTVGIYMMATSDKRYGVSLIPSMVPIEPTAIETVTFNDTKYYEFYFREGATVITNLNLVKDNKLIYSIFNEIISQGNSPWYLNYLDYAQLFKFAPKHAGVSIGQNHEVMQLLTSMLARYRQDKTINYRQKIESMADLQLMPPAMIPLRSVQYAATNSTTKFAGSYFRPALVSALVSRTDRLERVESILLE